jgi:TonB family protein
MFREPQPAASAPPVTASIPRTKPDTRLRVAGVAGSNQYLARVQARISGFWTAPPVDISGKSLAVTVRFRLERDGRVGSVIIEQSSGNDYYDMAAQRAVQSAIPLPPFPPDLTDSYFDAHFTFAVGEAAG